MGKPIILYPDSGTLLISILLDEPTNKMDDFGSFSLILLAIDIAGKICPPVPPHEIMYLFIFT